MPTISFKSQGVVNQRVVPHIKKEIPKKKKGSKITRFSIVSRRRLREKLIDTACPEDWKKYSCTLTIPGLQLTDELEYKLFFQFCRKINKFQISMIWRKEIQLRGSSHYHIIIFSPAEFDYLKIPRVWWQLLNQIDHFKRADMPGARQRSCDITDIVDCSMWSRYMQDHMTKTKKHQIAKIGRHWGIVGRKNLTLSETLSEYELSVKQWNVYRRVQRRLFTPFRKKLTAPFGYKLGYDSKRGVQGRSIFFSENSKKDALERFIKRIIL